MKKFIPFWVLLLFLATGLWTWGQFLIDPYRFVQPFTPESLPTIRYYWVASDLIVDAPVTNWIDRIAGFGLGQATVANQPTNTASGVYFVGTPIHLTNSPQFTEITGTTGSVWVVFSADTPASTLGAIVAGSSAGGRGIYAVNDGTLKVFGGVGTVVFGTYVSGTAMDVAIGITSPSTNAFWTNGLLATVATAGQIFNNDVKFAGKDGFADYYKGEILEIAFFTGLLTATEVANLHNYATNIYGYSP